MIEEINVQIDKKAIQQRIEKQLDECITSQLWWVSAERIAQLTDMSVRYAEEHILSDVRMKAIERRRSRKRFYPAKIAFEVVSEIMNSW